MNQKKLIISAIIIVAISFIGFLIGFLYKGEQVAHLRIQINAQGNVPGISVKLNDAEIGITDSTGTLTFEREFKENATFTLSFEKEGFNILPSSKKVIARSDAPDLNYTLKAYPSIPPELVIETRDWRGRIVPDAEILLNGKPLPKKTNRKGLILITLNDLPVGTLITLDARKDKMSVREGNEDVLIDGLTSRFQRKIVLFQAPENWFEFHITDGNNPIRGVKIIRDGKVRNARFNGKFYKDWVYDLNQQYAFTFRKTGYMELKRKFEPNKKGKNAYDIILEPLRFSVRVKDKTGLSKDMDNVIIYDRRNRELARTDADGLATNIPFPALNRNFTLKFVKEPDFPSQKITLKITRNNATQTVYIEPKSHERYIKLTWENGEPIKDAVVLYRGMEPGFETLRGRPNKNGLVVLKGYQLRPNREYMVTLKTAYGTIEEPDAPTEYMLANKIKLELTFKREGQLTIRLINGGGRITLKNSLGKVVAEGQDEISKQLLYGEYTITAQNSTLTKKEHISFYQASETFTINMTDPCELLSQKVESNPEFLATSAGQDKMDNLLDIIDEKENSGTALSSCEENMLMRYADMQFKNKEYFDAIEAYKMILKGVKGAKRKAINFQRLGQANLYEAMTNNSLGLADKQDRVMAALQLFEEARLKVPTSVNQKERRKFNTILAYNVAMASNYNYEINKMNYASDSELNRFRKMALDAWDDFKFQYSRCNNKLQQELANLKTDADRQIEELNNE